MLCDPVTFPRAQAVVIQKRVASVRTQKLKLELLAARSFGLKKKASDDKCSIPSYLHARMMIKKPKW